MDDYDLKVILSSLTPYEQAQVFCAVFLRWAHRPRRRAWIVEESYAELYVIG
jgi:hypothetical protein